MASFHELNRAAEAERSYPMSTPNRAPVWIGGVVIVVAIIGVFSYESGGWGSHRSVTPTPTHEITAPPPVNPAPPPDSPKP
jgi:hypothetical protein